jgi:hypothetical protein
MLWINLLAYTKENEECAKKVGKVVDTPLVAV